MSSKYEVVEKNKVKITFAVDAQRFEEGMQDAYNKNRSKLNVQGFRKGKAPRKIIEMTYGKEIFFEDAINFVLPDAYDSAVKELNLDVVSRPEIDVEEVSVENGAVITAEVYVKPEVKIDDYKGIQYEKTDVEVTEEEINAELDKVREQNSRLITVTDRPVQDGDTVTIDFEGFIDDVAFEGGKGTDYDLVIGSKSFIDTFEEQLVGHNVGDDVEVNVTFPENYGQPDLANKPALFKVEIKDIKFKELPEADDDFAQDVSEFDTLDEYKADIKAKLSEEKQKQADRKKENDIVDALVAKAEMEVPEVMFENQVDQMVNDFANQIRMQGLSLEMYLQYMGQDMESMRAAYRPGAESQVKGRLVLEAIAAKEDFAVSDEELDAEIVRIAENYGMEKERLLEVLRPEDKDGLVTDLKVKKALELVTENAVEA